MTIHRVPAGVDPGIRKPFEQVVTLVKQRLAGRLVPVNRLRGLHPEPFGVVLPALVNVVIAHGILLRTRCECVTQAKGFAARYFGDAASDYRKIFAGTWRYGLQIFANTALFANFPRNARNFANLQIVWVQNPPPARYGIRRPFILPEILRGVWGAGPPHRPSRNAPPVFRQSPPRSANRVR